MLDTFNFQAILGNRYGYQTFPCRIAQTEFEALLDVGRRHNVPHIDVLVRWYLLDGNAHPAQYVLQVGNAVMLITNVSHLGS